LSGQTFLVHPCYNLLSRVFVTKSIVPITIHMYRVYLYVHPIEVTLTMNRKKGIDIVKFKAFHS
jgi:hypothetical protein